MIQRFKILITIWTIFLGVLTEKAAGQMFCNPLNLNCRLDSKKSVNHSVADPTIVLYKDHYFLFASFSGGYWYSADLASWKFVTTDTLPFEKQAPTAVTIGDWLYFFTSYSDKIYRSNDPINGKWEVYNNSFPMSMISDIAVLLDSDGRVFCYYGCSNDNRLMMRELDVKDKLNPIGAPVECIRKNPFTQNSKKPAGHAAKTENPPVIGSAMNKYNGKYYYQCSELNPELQKYEDVVYVGEKHYGPFTYHENNPFASKQGGFVAGGSHGSTFADKYGNWWKITTVTLSGKQSAGTRLALFPAGFDNEGTLFTSLSFGDYPISVPNQKYSDISELLPGWSLLSYNKPAQASSHSANHSASFAFDENTTTFWSAQNSNKYEWLSVDLGSPCTINAVQVNFAENTSWVPEQDTVNACRYVIEYSNDKKNWKTLVDKKNSTDNSIHHFEVISTPVQAQYIRISNIHSPYSAFAISDFRIFGTGTGTPPAQVLSFFAARDFRNPNNIKLTWKKKSDVTGYNIRFGTKKDKLLLNYQVFDDSPVIFRVPNKSKTYWFQIEAFNENGVTKSNIHPSH